MQQRPEIVLPLATEFVQTCEIPSLIAEALHPPVTNDSPIVWQLTKDAKPGAKGKPAERDRRRLNSNDLKLLKGFWANLPPLELPSPKIPESEFQPYAEAFRKKGLSLNWKLTWTVHTPSRQAEFQRYEIARQHGQAIISAIRRRQLQVLHPETRLPTDEYETASLVTVEALSQYVAQFHINVRVALASNADLTRTGEQLAAPARSNNEGDDRGAEAPDAERDERFVDADGIQIRAGGEPLLVKGLNRRKQVDAWVKWTAKEFVNPNDKASELAARIQLTADKWGYQSERGKLTIASITKMLPTGITGGRAKARGRPKK